MKHRIIRVLLVYAAIAAAAGLYALVMELTGHGIPCIFQRVTGFKCPGCGNTHALNLLLKGRFLDAVKSNAMMPAEAGFAVWLTLSVTVRYVRTGKYSLTTGCESANIAFLVLLLLWWIVRNIIGI